MPLVVKDRVKVTTTTTGTGTLTLGAAATGFQDFSVIGNANTTYYAIVDSATGAWEVGIGTYTASGTTLARTTVLESSNANALVNFAAGSKDVFVTYAADALYDGAFLYDSIFKGIAVAFDTQTFNSSGTWTKPAFGSFALVEIWGGGGSGQRTTSATAFGGAGGGYRAFLFKVTELAATVTVTVGAGGAARTTTSTGAAGGTSSFGSVFTATGGAGGTSGAAGGSSTFPGSPYYVDSAFTFPTSTTSSTGRLFSETGGTPGAGGAVGTSTRSAGAGGGSRQHDGAVYTGSTAGGTSTFGGNGSSGSSGTASAGAQPGGGGGGAGNTTATTSGAGGDGRVKVTVY